ncbi:7965_t:CDS:2, partial [Acaulospora colombiana]
VSRSPDEITPPPIPSSSGAEGSSPPLNNKVTSQVLVNSPEARKSTIELPQPKKDLPGSGYVNGIWPILPKYIRRWDKPPYIPMAHIPIPAGSLGMRTLNNRLPNGWTMHVHPEGKPYYHRAAKSVDHSLLFGQTHKYKEDTPLCKPLGIFTDSDPRIYSVRKTLEYAYYVVCKEIAACRIELPQEVDLFLELGMGGG